MRSHLLFTISSAFYYNNFPEWEGIVWGCCRTQIPSLKSCPWAINYLIVEGLAALKLSRWQKKIQLKLKQIHAMREEAIQNFITIPKDTRARDVNKVFRLSLQTHFQFRFSPLFTYFSTRLLLLATPTPLFFGVCFEEEFMKNFSSRNFAICNARENFVFSLWVIFYTPTVCFSYPSTACANKEVFLLFFW